ncbi:single-stranded DNA-binding protein [Prochlorococcus sp. MIT 1223]|uniref:single-stranded DNA-binding protein n=1 Tax=Prochlorococcus sp. MIT 1223 TaxID=3096217 RepID=UPI002A75E5EF|nr:single-stranded DNA-binding protein [Prochlorococcus sp. MIT 1223]
MNHCMLEVQVKEAPTLRYTQDNKTPIAEMEVFFDNLRAEQPPSIIKVVGWGNMAQELQTNIKAEQKLVIEGRLRMNTVPKQDGTKEKKAEFTLSKIHLFSKDSQISNNAKNLSFDQNKSFTNPTSNSQSSPNKTDSDPSSKKELSWDTSPLVPDTDEIPF